MPSPFPGMDPYLEHPALWLGVHSLLIATLSLDLAPRLRPRYYVAVEERVYIAEPDGMRLVGRPEAAVVAAGESGAGIRAGDGWEQAAEQPSEAARGPRVLTVELPLPDPIRERYLEVRVPGSHEVVTVIEILSPWNKRPGEGRRQYEAKRQQALNSLTSLIEIDLLRSREPMPVWRRGQPVTDLPGDYRILVSRGHQRPQADLHVFSVREPIPPVPLPLRRGEEEPLVGLQDLLRTVYDQAGYDLRIDYHTEPVPPLRPGDAAWADQLLRGRDLR